MNIFYNRHLQTQKHKKNEEGVFGHSIENIDEAFKGQIEIGLFCFEEPASTSIIEKILMVKPKIEILIKNTLSKINTFKFYMGVKIKMTREGDEDSLFIIEK